MVRILIMDDQSGKTEKVRRILIEECRISESSIDCASTISEGRICLMEKYYDLLILDLVMPLYTDEAANHEESPNFIEEIFNNPHIIIPSQIIGLTAHEKEYDALKYRFEKQLWKLISYSESNVQWKDPIKTSVFHILRTKKRMLESINDKFHYDIGIICALQEEYTALLDAFGKDKWVSVRIEGIPGLLNERSFTNGMGEQLKIIAACVGRPGMVATASMATALFYKTNIEKIFMTGIAAGFRSDSINFCDIMVANSAMDYSSGKLVEDESTNQSIRHLKEIQFMNADTELISCANQLIGDSNLMTQLNQHLTEVHLNIERGIKAHMVPVACGPFVVASQDAIDEIKKIDRKLKALDMEAYGLYYAAHMCRKKALWIKGVSDFADAKKGDSYHQNAAYASAYFLYLLLKEY